ncbi:MAG: hypothetical protein NZM29_00970 [Nitrospira sp.]|nr:hypothetical protein [Nitrospira sp.]
MSVILVLEVARVGNRRRDVRHQQDGSRVVPFSDRLLIGDLAA